jgi:hypothetical protein
VGAGSVTGASTTDAEKTMTSFPPPAASFPGPDTDLSDAERTVTERTMTIPPLTEPPPPPAEGAPLIPDAILPPPTKIDLQRAPFEPVTDDPRSFGPAGAGGMGGVPPNGFPPAGRSGSRTGPSRSRRPLIIAAGVVGIMLLGIGTAFGAGALSGGSSHPRKAAVRKVAPPVATKPATNQAPKPSAKPKPTPPPTKVDIRDEKTDPRPLDIGEVFPDQKITLAGHTFNLVKTSLNLHCELTAHGPFANALIAQHCRRVVRATFLDTQNKLAVTAGIAVMPTDAAANAVQATQNPQKYEWFRGMDAPPGVTKIDQAGGYAASTLRGRYIIYAYATYADGHKPKPNDAALRTVGDAFRSYTAGPIDRRALR